MICAKDMARFLLAETVLRGTAALTSCADTTLPVTPTTERTTRADIRPWPRRRSPRARQLSPTRGRRSKRPYPGVTPTQVQTLLPCRP
jgi:hypothetical protein